MKTYLSVWFNANGDTPSQVTMKLEKIGFKVAQGNYDYIYDWGRKADIEEVIMLGDKIQKVLNGSNVLFKMETI